MVRVKAVGRIGRAAPAGRVELAAAEVDAVDLAVDLEVDLAAVARANGTILPLASRY